MADLRVHDPDLGVHVRPILAFTMVRNAHCREVPSRRLLFARYCTPLDELGYLPFERRSAHLFFHLVARRYERSSLLLTANRVVTQWGTVFGDDVLAAAILDRLLHHSHAITISGDSYRLKQKRKAGFFGSATQETRT